MNDSFLSSDVMNESFMTSGPAVTATSPGPAAGRGAFPAAGTVGAGG